MTTTIGPYTTGEIPPPLTVTFTDSDGDPIDLDGYQARWVTRARGSDTEATAVAVVDPDQQANTGQVTYTWVVGDLDTEGVYRGEMWVGNGTNRYASELFEFDVRAAIATPDI